VFRGSIAERASYHKPDQAHVRVALARLRKFSQTNHQWDAGRLGMTAFGNPALGILAGSVSKGCGLAASRLPRDQHAAVKGKALSNREGVGFLNRFLFGFGPERSAVTITVL